MSSSYIKIKTHYIRDAIMLMAVERPFTRWSELTGVEKERYEKKAQRVRTQLELYEPLGKQERLP